MTAQTPSVKKSKLNALPWRPAGRTLADTSLQSPGRTPTLGGHPKPGPPTPKINTLATYLSTEETVRERTPGRPNVGRRRGTGGKKLKPPPPPRACTSEKRRLKWIRAERIPVDGNSGRIHREEETAHLPD